MDRTYIAIDLKSFYASVECMERGLDPLTTNLVVADPERTEKTICLAVSPSLKAHGIGGRARLFEVVAKVKEANGRRNAICKASGRKSYHAFELEKHPDYAIDYLIAPPRMALYMEYSRRIYQIYLRYIAPEDIHVYSIDEVMMDVTGYLKTYNLTPRQLAKRMITEIFQETGITAAGGIGTNLYLCKVAMDIWAKHTQPDADGVRIAELDEISYRRALWTHRPLTDFWRIGKGYARKLEAHGMYTMGDVARCSLGGAKDYHNEDLLYKLFGINAELLIDHAWGWESCTMEQIKAYKPENNSITSGQVLHCAYTTPQTRIVVQEMADLMALELVEKGMVTDQMVLTVGYDTESLKDPSYKGPIKTDRYGRKIPEHAHGTQNLEEMTSSSSVIVEAVLTLYDRIINENLLVRRLNLTANHVIPEKDVREKAVYEQLDLFTDYEAIEQEKEKKRAEREKERRMQEAMLSIKRKFGNNAVLKGMNLQEGATTIERNRQIGGHKA